MIGNRDIECAKVFMHDVKVGLLIAREKIEVLMDGQIQLKERSGVRHGPNDIVKGRVPIVCLTAYTAPEARLLDPHVDILLVGDSLGMVVYGFKNTLPVTLDMMIAHGAAVVR